METVQVPYLCPTTRLKDSKECAYYWSTFKSAWGLPASLKHFPGANPKSIDRSMYTTLRTKAMHVALKSDGVRYFLFMTTRPNSDVPISVLIDRKLDMFEIEIWASYEFFTQTSIFDTELVWSNPTYQQMTLLVFDVMLHRGDLCISMPFRERMQLVQRAILTTYNVPDEDMERMLSEECRLAARNNEFDLRIIPKMTAPKDQMRLVWESSRECEHKNDGLILTMSDEGVDTGISSFVFKWKVEHTVDVVVRFDGRWTAWAVVEKGCLARVDARLDDTGFVQLAEDVVVECLVRLHRRYVRLVPERIRYDKSSANSMNTILATFQNVRESIELDELEREIA